MSLSKRTRFEVFKRDGFKCLYCGKTPPAVVLEIDHITPASGGGSDGPDNLLTACFDCNRGKAHIPLKKTPEALVAMKDREMEAEEQIRRYRLFAKRKLRRINQDIADITQIYEEAYEGYTLSDGFKSGSLKRFINSLPKHEVEEAIRIAVSKFNSTKAMTNEWCSSKCIPYFCGICWRKIRGDKHGEN